MKFKHLLLPLALFVCIAGILCGAAKATAPVREANRRKEQMEVMSLLLPGSTSFEEEAYAGEDTNITAVFKSDQGYVVETTVAGYVDDMVIWVGVAGDGIVTGITVRSMNETYGLGRRAMTDMSFLGQFIGTQGDAEIGVNVDGLAGATVSSKAVVKAANSAVAFVTGTDISSSATGWGG